MSTLSVNTIKDVQSFDFANTSFAGAYGTANSGYVVANASFTYGNSSYTVANAAFGKANNALANTSGTFNGLLTIGGEGIIVDRNAGDPYIQFNTSGSTTGTMLYGGSSTGYRVFTNGTERMRITSDGKIGVNTGSNTLYSEFTISGGAENRWEFSPNSATYSGGVIEYINRSSSTNRPDMSFYVGAANANIKFATGGLERMRITSSGRIAIGTSNPARQLVVSNNAFEGVEIGPGNINGDASGAVSSIYYNRTTSNYVNNIQDAAQHVWNLSGTERMRINGSGQLTIPYQPAYHAHIGGYGDYNITGIVPASSTLFNIGNHYNTSTYKFTAPVAGRYLFGYYCYSNSSYSTSVRMFILRNGSIQAQSGTYGQHNAYSLILDCGANDTIWWDSQAFTFQLYGSLYHNGFWGYLIG